MLSARRGEPYFSYLLSQKRALNVANLDFIYHLPAPLHQIRASEQHFPVVLFIMRYKVILTFESVDEIQKCDHSNEIY